VVLATGELLFCAHHARQHAPALSGIALDVQDETQRLTEQHGANPTL
jgi:4-hydroxyphenylpyruvate dioxygenase-like putative hemolysin